MFNLKEKLIKKNVLIIVKQFVKFGIVGVSNTLISLLVYYTLIYLNFYYIFANTAGFVVSVINAYYWNSKYVFISEARRNVIKSFVKVFMSYSATFVLGTALLYLWVDILNISDLIAPIINLVVTIPLNFLLNKLWAMK